LNDVPVIPLKDKIVDARLVEVYDGDTVKVVVMLGKEPFLISVRIKGIDAPEIKKSKGKLFEEHLAALKVKQYVEEMLRGPIIKVRFLKWDKFGGRIIGDVFTNDNQNVADILLEEGWVKPYNGEAKKEWTLEELTRRPFLN
jgi:endonuclease YncB( thermonuclease family)